MNNDNLKSPAPINYEPLRICPVPDDDPVGFFILGLFLFPVMLFGMLAVVVFGAFIFAHVYHNAVWLLQVLTGKP